MAIETFLSTAPAAELNPPGTAPGVNQIFYNVNNGVGNGGSIAAHTWDDTEQVTNGWDFGVSPLATVSERSGMWHFDDWAGGATVQPGNRLWQYSAGWRDFELTEGVYTGIDDMFTSGLSGGRPSWDSIDANPLYGGIFLQIRGVVTQYVIDGSTTQQGPTAPQWMIDDPVTYPTVTYPLSDGNGTVTHLDMTNTNVRNKYAAFLAEFASRMNERDDLKFVLLHGLSNTRGEEWGGSQTGIDSVYQWWLNTYLTTWRDNTDVDKRWKLAWQYSRRAGFSNNDFSFFDFAVNNGFGHRTNGSIEQWRYNEYTRGTSATSGLDYNLRRASGQRLDENGYLVTDENHPIHADNPPRQFQEQNEQHSFNSLFEHFMCSFRCLQMRFNAVWEPNGSAMNRPLVEWMFSQLGHNAATAPTAWCLLHESYCRTSSDSGFTDRQMNNFDRWVYQRDAWGATSGATNLVNPYYYSLGNPNDPNLERTLQGRYGASMGFAVDPRYLASGSHSVILKITYFDDAAGNFTVRNSTTTRQVNTNGANQVRTATIRFPTFAVSQTQIEADPSDYTPDFYIESSDDIPIMLVQVIKA